MTWKEIVIMNILLVLVIPAQVTSCHSFVSLVQIFYTKRLNICPFPLFQNTFYILTSPKGYFGPVYIKWVVAASATIIHFCTVRNE